MKSMIWYVSPFKSVLLKSIAIPKKSVVFHAINRESDVVVFLEQYQLYIFVLSNCFLFN